MITAMNEKTTSSYILVLLLAALTGKLLVNAARSRYENVPEARPSVIAHRGCSGRYPEMTPISFERAVDEGSDMMECDVCVTRDLKLVCTHESWMESQTNVADIYPESRKNTYFVDDDLSFYNDYFTVDFTLDELQLISKRQRYDYRDPNHDDLYPMCSFEEYIQIAQGAGKAVGLLVEVKDPIWADSLDFMQEANTTIGDLVIDTLAQYGYTGPNAAATIQCFDENFIRSLRPKTQIPLAFLVNSASDVTDEKLIEYAQFGNAIGAAKSLIVRVVNDEVVERTDLVDRAHAADLDVFAWTFRNEDRYLAWDYGQDPWNEYMDFLQLNVDGFITDFPETANMFLDSVYNCTSSEL